MKEIAQILLKIGAVRLSPNEPFTWASGLKAPIYCDNRKLLSHVRERNEIVDALVKNAGTFKPDAIVGVATGADSWGAYVSVWSGYSYYGLPFAYVRSKAKDHGLGNQIEGDLPEGCNVVVVEDLISTGGSSLKAVQALRDAGFNVLGMVAIFSYQFPEAEEAFRKADVPLITATNYTELVEVAHAQGLFGAPEMELLSAWRRDHENWGK